MVVLLMAGGGLVARQFYRRPAASPAPVLALPSSTARPLSEQPGPDTVELTPGAAAHPEHEAVRTVLQNYFDAINAGDYDAWTRTVAKARVQAKTPSQWRAEYSTTKDGSILVYRIDSMPNGDLRVFLAFTSTQDVSHAPAELPQPCVRWNLVFPLTRESGQLRIDAISGAPGLEVSRC